ncbi:AAA family ATPase [Candidatus Pantoea persica]|uniref:AAA family ATPase n=1 Tax=Candidatus Pantoea persica TaxID=2518128 RepID=UPI0035A96A2A|nr:Cysteine--tRNA ligase [Candidatus Pantoea persica]
MPVEKIEIRGFRLVRQLSLPQINVVSGPNGCGKSNLYKAVKLLHDAASGRHSEGDVGRRALRRGDRRHDPRRLTLAAQIDDLEYPLEIGFPEPLATTRFNLDPLVKEERIWLSG